MQEEKDEIERGEANTLFEPRSSKSGSKELEKVFNSTTASIQRMPVGGSICDVCGKSMNNAGIAVNIIIWDRPEADQVLKIFGKQTFSICFVCFLRALGMKEHNRIDDE